MTQENSPSRSQAVPAGEKRVMMPSAEEMTAKLAEVGLIGKDPQTDKFYADFLKRVSGSEKVAAGLNLAWEVSLSLVMKDYPSIFTAELNLAYDQAIDTVTPDEEVAQEAKNIRMKVFEEMRRRMKKNRLKNN